jgi:peptide/nickel transport system substrate-binding protein
MTWWRSTTTAILLALGLLAAPAALFAQTQNPKYGGVLTLMQREELPQGLSILETSTIATVWPASPCFNNLVYFDPAKPMETPDTIVGELAEKWSWQDGYRNLVFFLRRDVKWHDGQPFTSRDVKFTFDLVRGAPDAVGKLRLNPRKDWYANVEAIEAADPYTVVFRLKRPQPSILMMLASGQSPIYPAHVPLAEQRNRCVGTGPFKLKEWRRGEYVEYVKNPDYFVKGRPYLDGLKYVIISERGTRTAALQAGRLDSAAPGEITKNIADQLKAAVPGMVVTRVGSLTSPNLLVNHARPPFNDARVRRAVDLAIDRDGYIKGVLQGGGVAGAALVPKPFGSWGLGEGELVQILGRPEGRKALARKLLAEAGYGPSAPLRFEAQTRGIATYVDLASYVVSELRQVGVEITVKQLDSVQWYGVTTRKEFQLGINISGYGVDDPDAILFENYTCTSLRNYTSYCDEGVSRLIEQQSQELDLRKRVALVHEIQKKLTEAGARPTVAWGIDFFAQWPHVKNLVPHHSLYSFGRMQNVWLDR